jgi:hypothetical protein
MSPKIEGCSMPFRQLLGFARSPQNEKATANGGLSRKTSSSVVVFQTEVSDQLFAL